MHNLLLASSPLKPVTILQIATLQQTKQTDFGILEHTKRSTMKHFEIWPKWARYTAGMGWLMYLRNFEEIEDSNKRSRD